MEICFKRNTKQLPVSNLVAVFRSTMIKKMVYVCCVCWGKYREEKKVAQKEEINK